VKPEALRHVSAERTAPNVLTVRVDCQNNQRFLALLRSDAHHDNGHTDQAMEKRHLREAVERGAAVLDIGDLHCAMQGKWDRRASRDGMRPEYQSGNYLDRLVECAAEFYAPYAEHLLHFSPGNHETAIIKAHETDLTDRTVNALRERGAADLTRGSYAGWIALRLNYGSKRRSFVIRYTHGYGGGGMMTHGILATRREASQFPDAQLLWSGPYARFVDGRPCARAAVKSRYGLLGHADARQDARVQARDSRGFRLVGRARVATKAARRGLA